MKLTAKLLGYRGVTHNWIHSKPVINRNRTKLKYTPKVIIWSAWYCCFVCNVRMGLLEQLCCVDSWNYGSGKHERAYLSPPPVGCSALLKGVPDAEVWYVFYIDW